MYLVTWLASNLNLSLQFLCIIAMHQLLKYYPSLPLSLCSTSSLVMKLCRRHCVIMTESTSKLEKQPTIFPVHQERDNSFNTGQVGLVHTLHCD